VIWLGYPFFFLQKLFDFAWNLKITPSTKKSVNKFFFYFTIFLFDKNIIETKRKQKKTDESDEEEEECSEYDKYPNDSNDSGDEILMNNTDNS
jgi:hypothetical protein